MKNKIRKGTSFFSAVIIGDQSNGLITTDVGWAGIHLFESLGIESTIGIDGFECAAHFKKWTESVVGMELKDWEPIEILLYECWMPCLHDQFPLLHDYTAGANEANRYDDQFCYMVWRESPDPDAIKATRRNVFALRHQAYYLKSEREPGFLHSAWKQSYKNLKAQEKIFR
ncbi:hypothetical protein M2404_004052 [Rheinheimera pacifica]|uniref:hypothetical protein n=1 Tax=Rheinheimera pacifica TaxID=173990 RepID=UPI00216AAEAA|nr:hypothetical protein [Rheinheimera pacifica]MCS4309675.1 hypothetical protein [Rheinheimera pacifica]